MALPQHLGQAQGGPPLALTYTFPCGVEMDAEGNAWHARPSTCSQWVRCKRCMPKWSTRALFHALNPLLDNRCQVPSPGILGYWERRCPYCAAHQLVSRNKLRNPQCFRCDMPWQEAFIATSARLMVWSRRTQGSLGNTRMQSRGRSPSANRSASPGSSRHSRGGSRARGQSRHMQASRDRGRPSGDVQ